MLRLSYSHLIIGIFVLFSQSLVAKENVTNENKLQDDQGLAIRSRVMGCTAPTSTFDIAINNVKARLMNGGDMWWNFNNAAYEVPKDGGVSSLFAGAIWIGGIDGGGQLKVAAQTYRQSGSDFFSGPLDDEASITNEECNEWDQHFQVTRSEIDAFIAEWESTGSITKSSYPNIVNWPAKGNPNNELVGSKNLAAFVDNDGDGSYDPEKGDYPKLDLSGGNCGDENVAINPDQMVYWVYNDRGNIHGETGAEAIGLEIQATAFAFATNDEINDMTFYRYKIANKSSIVLNNTYMAQWVDADLGAFNDDFVGCDTSRSLGICYNGDAVDGPTSPNYGDQPPIVGIDFFEGPKDTAGNELGMAVFLYYNNDFTITGNPETAPHYYGYLSGTWKDGTQFTSGGNGYGGSVASSYMFPSDPADASSETWSECSEGNTPADRRFLESAGPFVLLPGAVNNVTIGAVWVQPKNAYPCPTFKTIQAADDKAQSLFNNCFKLLEGPKAPDVEVRELDGEIILTITNSKETEAYEEKDPRIVALSLTDSTITDSTYNFQGYVVYQLANANVSASQLDDRSLSRIVASVDIEDGVSSMVNYGYDDELNYNIPFVKAEQAEDKGIKHSFKITEDLFATGAKQLVNGKSYYFTVVPYGYNNYKQFDPNTEEGIHGQKLPYIESRVFKISPSYVAIPHITSVSGVEVKTEFGQGPDITRVYGQGNGGFELELTDESIEELSTLKTGIKTDVTYKAGKAPVEILVYDPLKVKRGTYTIHFVDSVGAAADAVALDSSSTWYILDENGTQLSVSDTMIGIENEQIISELGLIVRVQQTTQWGAIVDDEPLKADHGLISSTVNFSDDGNRWLSGVADGDGISYTNWIRAGGFTSPDATGFDDESTTNADDDQVFLDPDGIYETIFSGTDLQGTWAPAKFVNTTEEASPGAGSDPIQVLAPLAGSTNNDAPSVNIVFTTDQTKWTICPVVETQGEQDLTADQSTTRLTLKNQPGYARTGGEILNTATGDNGISFFPGYAINVETGQRMCVIFGEDSWLIGENGNDMLWNPTDVLSQGSFAVRNWKYGGKHFVYVLDKEYTSNNVAELQFELAKGNAIGRNNAFRDAVWVGVPMLAEGFEFRSIEDGYIPNDITLKIRVENPLSRYDAASRLENEANVYSFTTDGLAPDSLDVAGQDSVLDLVNVVPNPYYGFSEYETSQLDNRIKITNLPDSAVISIFSLDGTLIRKFDRSVLGDENDNVETFLEWDLKNHRNIPVSSGIYLIHINDKKGNERTIKWFGIMRPQDLDSF